MKKLLGIIVLGLLFVVNFASTSSAQEDYYFKNCNHQNYSYSYFIDLKKRIDKFSNNKENDYQDINLMRI